MNVYCVPFDARTEQQMTFQSYTTSFDIVCCMKHTYAYIYRYTNQHTHPLRFALFRSPHSAQSVLQCVCMCWSYDVHECACDQVCVYHSDFPAKIETAYTSRAQCVHTFSWELLSCVYSKPFANRSQEDNKKYEKSPTEQQIFTDWRTHHSARLSNAILKLLNK